MRKLMISMGFLAMTTSAMAGAPEIYSDEGKFLGNLGSQYDPNSVHNPYGRYGSQYAPESVNNPYGRYGNPYSPDAVPNPYNPYDQNGDPLKK